jgi:hypothetical protein
MSGRVRLSSAPLYSSTSSVMPNTTTNTAAAA